MGFCLLLKLWAKISVTTKAVNIGRKFLIMLKHTNTKTTDTLKTAWKRAIQKTVGSTVDLIVNKIANKITKVSKTLAQISSDTVTNEAENIEHGKEKPKEKYVSPKKIFFDILRLI